MLFYWDVFVSLVPFQVAEEELVADEVGDVDAPRKPYTSYILFAKSKRKEILDATPGR